MRKIWGYKLFQWIVFILIASSLGIIVSKLDSLQFFLKNTNLANEDYIIIELIKDLNVVRILVIILGAFSLGLYSDFKYSINKNKHKINE